MDLTVPYMSLELTGPFIAGASPLWADVGHVSRVEEAGASAVVLPSLFEEQVMRERLEAEAYPTAFARSYAHGLEAFPRTGAIPGGADEYVAHVSRVKRAVSIPVIGSLNGVSPTGWVRYAQRIEAAGADGIELNLYYLPFDPEESSEEVENRYLEVLSFVRQEVRIPVAVKLSPFLTAPLNMARRLERCGADTLVLFNRFYQPDFDIDSRELRFEAHLSDPSDLVLRLRWLAALYGNVQVPLAATGGIWTGRDAIKAIMAGASAVQVTSALLRHGPQYLAQMRLETMQWMEEHGFESIRSMRGAMSLLLQSAPAYVERGGYAKVLRSWPSLEKS